MKNGAIKMPRKEKMTQLGAMRLGSEETEWAPPDGPGRGSDETTLYKSTVTELRRVGQDGPPRWAMVVVQWPTSVRCLAQEMAPLWVLPSMSNRQS